MIAAVVPLHARVTAGGARRHGLKALAAGVVLALGQAPYDLPFLGFLAWPALVWLLAATPGPQRAAWIGWCAGAGYFGLTLTWIIEPFLVDIARHGILAPFALVGMAGGLALFWMAGFGLARVVANRGIHLVVALATALALAEFGRATLLTGFPWALPAYAWAATPVAQGAAFVGPHFLGAVVVGLMAAVAIMRPVPLMVAFAGIALAWGAGSYRAHLPTAQTDVTVRLVQPNAAQHLKWQPQHIPIFLDRLQAGTAAPGDVDVVIWPESSYPARLGTRPELEAQLAAGANGAYLIMGAVRYDPMTEAFFNSLAVLDPAGSMSALYDKHHLVPFGEYIPLAAQMRQMGLGGLAGLAGGMSAGPGARLVSVAGLPTFQPLICYEAIFPHQILRGSERPKWLVQATNDAWFGTWSGPYQHLAQAQMRAIEQGLPMARAANTGISAMIGPRGQIIEALGLGVHGHLDAVLPEPLPATLYSRTGDMPWTILLVITIIALLLRRQAS